MDYFQSEHFVKNKEVIIIISIILGVLVLASLLFFVMGKFKSGHTIDELKMRTKSWWVMAFIFVSATVIDPVISYFALGL